MFEKIDGCGLGQNGKRQLERLLGIATIVPCEPGMGAAEDNSRLSTHERKPA